MNLNDTLFYEAVQHTLEFEGGFVNDRIDPGGATNWGISIRYLKQSGQLDNLDNNFFDYDGDGDVDADDMRLMPVEDAVAIYKEFWWDKYHYYRLAGDGIAVKIFDLSVNQGPRQAHKHLQRSCNYFQKRLVVDGVIGPATTRAVREIHKGYQSEDLRNLIIEETILFYSNLIVKKPELSKYLSGWTRRACA